MRLGRAIIKGSSCLSVNVRGISDQLQPINPLVFAGVLGDVSVWHPRVDDAERKQRFRYSKEGHHVRMYNVLPPYDLTIEPLIIIRLCPHSD